ncbi:MAG: hypothetical protein HKP30_05725 [Myxococcales bacterium]|nr:hypothetical protein [Myxococcales bacterium]
MRAYQVFAAMAPELAERLLETLSDKAPGITAQAIAVAAATMNARPQYMRKQPFAKRAAAVRRGLARVKSNDMAEEVLAVYFLECRKELLEEWLGILGLEHEDGILKDDEPPKPSEADLKAAVDKFRSGGDDADRELLLQAFAAQVSIDWPELDALVAPA